MRLQAATGLVVLMLARPAAAQTGTQPAAAVEEAARLAQNVAGATQAVSICRSLIAARDAPAAVRQRAHETLALALTRIGRHAEAVTAATSLATAFPGDPEADRRSVFAAADAYWSWKASTNPAPAIALLAGFVQRWPTNTAAAAQALLRISRFQGRGRDHAAAAATALQAASRNPADVRLGIDALWLGQEQAAQAKQPERRLEALRKSLERPYLDGLSEYDRSVRRDLVASTLRELKRGGELRVFATELAVSDPSPQRRQEWAYQVAEAWTAEARHVEALAAYEKVFTEHPRQAGRWYESQSRIVDALAHLGRTNDALRAGHVLWNAARDSRDSAMQRLAALLAGLDGNRSRADALTAMLRFGPAGKDGKAGTTDDPAPVLPSIGYPDLSGRRAALVAAFGEVGDQAESSVHRAVAMLYSGDPSAALVHFADALRRCRADAVPEMTRQLLHGVRALDGHSGRAQEIAAFVAEGRPGPDQKPGSADDRSDPIAAWAGQGGQGPGGAVPLQAEDAAQLRRVMDELRLMAGRPGTAPRRVASLNAWQRAIQALVIVDGAGTAAWVQEALARESDASVQAALVRLGQTASKAGRYEMTAVRAFDASTVRLFERMGQPPPAGVSNAWKQTSQAITSLTSGRL